MVKTMVDDYRRKVAEVAMHQCRCEVGADLEAKKRKADPPAREHPKAA